MNLSWVRRFHQQQRFDELPQDRWRAEVGVLSAAELADLRRRGRIYFWWKALKGLVRFPAAITHYVINLSLFLADLERLHGAPRRELKMGTGCVLDRQTWLVNGSNIHLGNHVKVSAFSALIAGYDARIQIGNYSILGPGVFVVAANHGIAMDGAPIRYQTWSEREVIIGDDVWVGANAVILPGATIGSGSIIGAGTVVSGEIPAGFIAYQDKGSLVMRRRR